MTAVIAQPKVSKKWRKLFALIPGYDPCDQAGDCTFDSKAAQQAIDFFAECIKHVKGAKAGQPFILEPWQIAVTGCLFGWKRPDGTRRYREALLYVGKKNGKTAWSAGLVLLVLATDGERGAELYSAASSKDQASHVFEHAAGMVKLEPELSKRLKVYGDKGGSVVRSIAYPEMMSRYKCLAADANTADGANVSLAVIDELHRHKSPELAEVLQKSTAARAQPLVIYTTTADYNRPSLCNTTLGYAKLVRDNKGNPDQAGWDPAFLPVIYEASRDDDWESPETWRKANPNLGVSLSEEFLARECRKAKDVPTELNNFLRLHLNIVTDASESWLDISQWDKGAEPFDPAILEGRECFAGLDLATTLDMTALVLLFPDDDVGFYVLPYFWVPENAATKRDKMNRTHYWSWIRQGFVTDTGGDQTDYDVVRADINALADKFSIKEIAFDRLFQGAWLSGKLQEDGFVMRSFGQGYADMAAPSVELERLVVAGKIRHGGNPVLRWHAGNVVIKMGEAGVVKPDKRKSSEKIDGIVALIMALGRSLLDPGLQDSVYETRGIITL